MMSSMAWRLFNPVVLPHRAHAQHGTELSGHLALQRLCRTELSDRRHCSAASRVVSGPMLHYSGPVAACVHASLAFNVPHAARLADP
jgi:hypothetical protein